MLYEPKFNDLDYDVNVDQVTKKVAVGIPEFKKQMPRKQMIPGVNSGMLDPTGYSYIDESNLGREGQGYGLASYKKGLKTESTIDIIRANRSQINLKEHRSYNQLPFS